MAWAKRVDGNHSTLVKTFEQLGCSVLDLSRVGGGAPDLLIGIAGVNVLVEVKLPGLKLRKNQTDWVDAWRGPVETARTQQDVIDIVNRYRKAA